MFDFLAEILGYTLAFKSATEAYENNMDMMPEIFYLKEKYNLKNATISEYVAVDNYFEIFGKICDYR